ncbi:unnamed protein product, partial [Symbiodinium pilosum]
AEARLPWHRVRTILQGLEVSRAAAGVMDVKGSMRQLQALQVEVLTALRGVAVEEALANLEFSDEILPRLWRLLGDREAPAETGGLGLVPREAGCADPVFEETVNIAALWDKESDTGWYLYRLAAIDPTM